jgi:hypothetical protein
MPSELVRTEKRRIRNEKTGTYQLESDIEQEEDSYEIVDKFRFFIDPDSLRNAIMQKTSLKMRQSSSTETSDQNSDIREENESNKEITMDQSLLDKLASGEAVIDDTGENTIIRLTLDHDDFAAMIDNEGNEESYDDDDDDYDEDIYSSVSTYMSREEKIKNKDSMVYSTARMAEAESSLLGNEKNYGAKAREDQDTDRMIRHLQENFKKSKLKKESQENDVWDGEDIISDDDDDDYESDSTYDDSTYYDRTSKVKIGSKENDVWDGEDIISNDDNNDYDGDNNDDENDNEKTNKKTKGKPRQYLADMSMGHILGDLHGTFVIGSVMAVLFNLNEFISLRIINGIQSLCNIIINSIPILKVRKMQILRSPKPLLILSILLLNAISFGLKIWIDSNRYAGIGYKEGQKQKKW